MNYTVSRTFKFSATHQLSGPPTHPCSKRVHDHTYEVRLTVTGVLDTDGILIDPRTLDPFSGVLRKLSGHLNDLVGFPPTIERLSSYFACEAAGRISWPPNAHYVHAAVSDTGKVWAECEPVRVHETVKGEGYVWNDDSWGPREHPTEVHLPAAGWYGEEPKPEGSFERATPIVDDEPEQPVIEHHTATVYLTGEGNP